MKAKEIEVVLLPSDFIDVDYCDNEDCSLARATKRKFKSKSVSVDSYEISVEDGEHIGVYKIKDRFTCYDFEFIKGAYKKDPKMLKKCYVVTLIKQ